MCSTLACSYVLSFTALVTITLTGCDSGWSGVHKEAGPLPLSSPDKPIVRLVDKRTTFEVGEEKRLFWDEGTGPILAEERVKSLGESIPKELHDRLYSTRDVPANLYQPLRDAGDKGTTYEYIYDTWVTVVSLNPDVLIISARETPVGPHSPQPPSWDRLSMDQARREYLQGRVEHIPSGRWPIDAGTLVPWSDEMHVFSTDPRVKSGRLTFEENRAEVLLPVGKLLLVHHDDDVDVSRE
jgi:hypothetical protein